MAEPLKLFPTPTRLHLLADVAAGRVIDDEDFAPHLHHDEGTSRVADAVWQMRTAGWCEQVTTDRRWSLTALGEQVLAAADVDRARLIGGDRD